MAACMCWTARGEQVVRLQVNAYARRPGSSNCMRPMSTCRDLHGAVVDMLMLICDWTLRSNVQLQCGSQSDQRYRWAAAVTLMCTGLKCAYTL